MNDVAFVSVAFGYEYLEQQKRLRESILKIYPEANLVFFFDCLPPTSRTMYESLYGFKPHAVQEALNKGFKRIIWLDPAMILMDKVDDLFAFDVVAVKDDNRLFNLISEPCLKFYDLTREEIEIRKWHLVGGSLYYFDFNKIVTNDVFKTWLNAEKQGLFGSQQEQASEKINGHRSDETLMALAMYFQGLEPQGAYQVRYCIANNPMFIKKHFKL